MEAKQDKKEKKKEKKTVEKPKKKAEKEKEPKGAKILMPIEDEESSGDEIIAVAKKKAKKARKLIISTISLSVMVYDEGKRDPTEMWKILEDRYKPRTRAILRQLQRQFNTFKMTDDDGDMEPIYDDCKCYIVLRL